MTAKSAGTAVITAKVADKTATCTVTVKKKEIPLESISIDIKDTVMKQYDVQKVSVVYNPDNTTVDKTVTWSTDDEQIVTVDHNGMLRAVGVGTTMIHAEVAGKMASCEVTVEESGIVVDGITLDKTEVSLEEGTEYTLHALVDANADVDLYWTSSDENVVTVVNGKLTAVNAGTAVIRVYAGDKVAECKVTVTEKTVDPGTPEKPVSPETPDAKPDDGSDTPVFTEKEDAQNEEKPGTVKTGDPATLGLLGTALALSSGVIAKFGRRKNKKEEE